MIFRNGMMRQEKCINFPKSYLKYLTRGARVIYYKGVMQDKAFASKRMTDKAYYFGIGEVGNTEKDTTSAKGDYYAQILNFQAFDQPVLSKLKIGYLETIPTLKAKNYWRNGVRPKDKGTYDKIISMSNLNSQNATNDGQQGKSEAYTSYEGNNKKTLSTKYERDNKLRDKAMEIHGFTCMGCGFNFKEKYGEWVLSMFIIPNLFLMVKEYAS